MSSPWPTPPVFVLAIALAAITVTASFSTFYGKSHTCVDVCIRAQWTGDNNNNRREDANALSKEQLVHKHCTETWADAWPTISFTGALAPEYYIFAVGLSLTAIVGFVALIHLHRNVHAAALKTKPCCGCCVSPCEHVHAGLACLGLAAVGIFSVADFTSAHTLAAFCFFLFTSTHTLQVWQAVIRYEVQGCTTSVVEAWNRLALRHRAKLAIVLSGCCVAVASAVTFALTSETYYTRRAGPLIQWTYVLLIGSAFGVHTWDSREAAADVCSTTLSPTNEDVEDARL